MPRLRTAFCVLVLASGCGSLRPLDDAPLRQGVLPALAPNEGILVVRVDTEVPIATLRISGIIALSDLARGNHFRLLAVKVGGYRWSGFTLSDGAGGVPFWIDGDDFFGFRVEPGRTSYPGDIAFRGYRIISRNRSALALRELLERYPGLLERYPPIYTGRDVDPYLDHYSRTFLAPGKAVHPDPP